MTATTSLRIIPRSYKAYGCLSASRPAASSAITRSSLRPVSRPFESGNALMPTCFSMRLTKSKLLDSERSFSRGSVVSRLRPFTQSLRMFLPHLRRAFSYDLTHRIIRFRDNRIVNLDENVGENAKRKKQKAGYETEDSQERLQRARQLLVNDKQIDCA